jgi:hypothetical protein
MSQTYEIRGPWSSGPSDPSSNRLQTAATNNADMIGLRSTFDENNVFFVPRGQVEAFAKDIETGSLELPRA